MRDDMEVLSMLTESVRKRAQYAGISIEGVEVLKWIATEALVRGVRIDDAELKSKLSELGALMSAQSEEA